MANLNHGTFGHQVPLLVGSATNHVVDASNEGIAWAFQAANADAIAQVGFRYGARSGTCPVYSITLEGIDGSGNPDGTDVGGGSPTLVTFTPPADTTWDGTWRWLTLTNAYTPTRGQKLMAVVRYSSGTIDGSNNSSFTRSIANVFSPNGFPYHNNNSGGTWVAATTGMTFGWRTASNRYGWIGTSVYNTATANTAGHRSLMHFTLPSGEASTFKLLGFRGQFKWGAAAGSAKGVLLDSSGSVIQDVTFDADQAGTNTGGYQVFFDESSLTSLSYGTKYYVGIECVSGTCGLRGVNLAEAEDRECYPNGLNRGLGTSSGGAITDNNLVLPSIELILDEITAPSGSGGGGVIIQRIPG